MTARLRQTPRGPIDTVLTPLALLQACRHLLPSSRDSRVGKPLNSSSGVLDGLHPGSRHRIIDELRDRALQVAPVHDPVDEAVLEQEFAGLEAVGELDAEVLLDHPRAG